MDNSYLQDVTKSVDLLCSQMSITNVVVPRFTNFNDVFDFLTEYEMATTSLSETQKNMLLAKAFPPGRHRSWYETDSAPLIDQQKSWSTIKSKIIQRFSDTEDRDRHFVKLREYKFDPEGGQRLLDYVEDLLYSYKKAYPNDVTEESRIRYIKASIPASLKSSLGMIPDYNNASTVDTLKRAVKQFDVNRGSPSTKKTSDKGALELASTLKELIKGIQLEGQATRNAITAALSTRPESQNVRFQGVDNKRSYPSRSPSPYRNRSASPNYSNARPPSPRVYNYEKKQDLKQTSQEPKTQQVSLPKTEAPAFSNEKYYGKFGKPGTPCKQCGDMHWQRHCIEYLN